MHKLCPVDSAFDTPLAMPNRASGQPEEEVAGALQTLPADAAGSLFFPDLETDICLDPTEDSCSDNWELVSYSHFSGLTSSAPELPVNSFWPAEHKSLDEDLQMICGGCLEMIEDVPTCAETAGTKVSLAACAWLQAMPCRHLLCLRCWQLHALASLAEVCTVTGPTDRIRAPACPVLDCSGRLGLASWLRLVPLHRIVGLLRAADVLAHCRHVLQSPQSSSLGHCGSPTGGQCFFTCPDAACSRVFLVDLPIDDAHCPATIQPPSGILCPDRRHLNKEIGWIANLVCPLQGLYSASWSDSLVGNRYFPLSYQIMQPCVV
ncbi:unnamed protein product [Protopolystoma xenopodis]|uniref:Uncharacterized protein n=1 Tax=Protopolystoma xenopodis TaxID=117903 RepID=A0A3S4ZZJ2_9PLAT|nr:unnamed protein product [Protopolystoma xenopodis]